MSGVQGIEFAGHAVASAMGVGLVGLVQARQQQARDARMSEWLDEVESRQRSDAARARGLENSLMACIEDLVLARGSEDAAVEELARVDAENVALRAQVAALKARVRA